MQALLRGRIRSSLGAIAVALLLCTPPASAQTFSATPNSPTNVSWHVARDASILVDFDEDVDQTTVSTATFTVSGNQSGNFGGTFTFPAANQIQFDPTNDFRAGEEITVVLNAGLRSTGGSVLNDHQWSFLAQAGSGGSGHFGARNTITTEDKPANWQNYQRSIHVFDLDRDGDLDIVSAPRGDDLIQWYENDGSQGFTAHTIANEGGSQAYAADLDGDGDNDVVVAHYLADKVTWHRNDGSQNFTSFEIYQDDAFSTLKVLDVDSDGDLDIMLGAPQEIVWLENNGSESFTRRVIEGFARETYSIHPIDFDNDGDLDVVAAIRDENEVNLYVNDGAENFTQTVAWMGTQTEAARPLDFDRDGDLDILAFRGTLTWLEQVAPGFFLESTVAEGAGGWNELEIADINGDGNLDLLAANGRGFAWVEYDESELDYPIHKHVDDFAHTPGAAYPVDMDGDGLLDVVAITGFGLEIYWYEQTPGDVELRGNGVAIVDGDTTPDAADHTLFEFAAVEGSASSERTFEFTNVGTGAVSLDPLVQNSLELWFVSEPTTISGEHASDFLVLDQFSEVLAPGATASFRVRFNPSAAGLRNATLTIGSDDEDEPTYTVALQGGGLVPLVATDDEASTNEDQAVTVDVLGNDDGWQGDVPSIQSVSDPVYGSTSISNGQIVYTPDQDYFGPDTFTYTISAGSAQTEQATVTVTVAGVNDPPTITGVADQTILEDGTTGPLDFTVQDVDTAQLTVSAVSSNQALIPDASVVLAGTGDDRTVTATPVAGGSGAATITLTVTDGEFSADTDFTVTVQSVNNPPSAPVVTSPADAASIDLEGDPDRPVTVTWDAAVDPDGSPLTYRWEAAREATFGTVDLLRNVGTSLTLELTYESLDSLLTALGFDLGVAATVHHRVVASDGVNSTPSASRSLMLTRGMFTGVDDDELPAEFSVRGVYPNPFRSGTTILLDAPHQAYVAVSVFDALGREVVQVDLGLMAGGSSQPIRIDAARLPGGVYFYRLDARSVRGTVWSHTGGLMAVR